MSELRCTRISELLRGMISEIFTRHLRDEIGFTTITEIKITPDLRNATVYYSVLGSDEEKEKTAVVLENARPFINSQIGRNLHIKYTPVIKFEYDETPARASRVFELLNQIEEEKIAKSTKKISKKPRRYKKRSKKRKK
ncbi:MAG: 30S ribosome-binding factor RbfA [Elusimicrobia bacterium]|nr:30S ribosome-binding factor RbfA [Elusimicrobiota bacterium]